MTKNFQVAIGEILKASIPLSDPAAGLGRCYLEHRGLDPRILPQNLLYHPGLEYFGENGRLVDKFPALVGMCRTTTIPNVTAIQRIYLSLSGEKAPVDQPKKIIGKLNGSFLLYDDWAEEMNIGEGPETMLAVRQVTLLPTVSSINAANLVNFEPPEMVKRVRIWCDSDKSGTGEKYAAQLARKLFDKGLTVYVHIPGKEINGEIKGIDWLDELVEFGPESILGEHQTRECYQLENKDENLVCMATVATEPVEWLWFPFIPKGKVTFLEGDPGQGKSFITLGLAKALSQGEPLPGNFSMPTGNVVLFCTEDGLGDTIRPRLEAMGANLERIQAYKVPIVLDDEGKVAIENAARVYKPRLIVLDPLSAFLSGAADINKANHPRQFMSWLAEAARRFDCAVLIVRHITKGARDQAIYRGLGSIDFTAAARSVLLVGCNPRDKSQRAIFHTKSNLAKFGGPVGYAVEEGKLAWTGSPTFTIEEAFQGNQATGEKTSGPSAVDDAVTFLTTSLAEGKKLVAEVKEEADRECIPERTLARAKKQLGVKSVKDQAPDGKWYWCLPEEGKISDGSYYDRR